MIVQEGVRRGLMAEVPEQDIFRDQHGQLVLNGAMGVDKPKVIEGKTVMLLRFISILVPANAYLRPLRGDSGALPYLNQLSLALLDEQEELLLDSSDMESAFNLFALPACWRGLFAFSRPVPRTAWGGSGSELAYVALTTIIPMGWLGAVDIVQRVARTIVFKAAGLRPGTELLKANAVPEGDVAVVCMDGLDCVRRVPAFLDERLRPGPSQEHLRFVKACADLNIPLSAGKTVV